MLYREIIAVCSEKHTKHINTLCGQNVELFYCTDLVVHIVTTALYRDKYSLSPSVATLYLVAVPKKPVYIPPNISKWQWELVPSNLQPCR